MEQIEKKNTFKLPNKKVRVMPILRQGAWLQKGHDGEFMFSGTSAPLSVPKSALTGQLVNPLTSEEQEFLEMTLAKNPGDLSIYKKGKDNFWNTYYVKLDKEGTTLDLSDPSQYIQYKVLLVNRDLISDSFLNRNTIPTARWMITDLDQEQKAEVAEANLLQSVWMEFGAIKNDTIKLKNIVKLHTNKTLPKNVKNDFLITEVKKIIDTNPNNFIKIIQDENFAMKCFIEEAVEVGSIIKVAKNKYSIMGDPDEVYTTTQLIEELDPEGPNSALYIKIKTQIENS